MNHLRLFLLVGLFAISLSSYGQQPKYVYCQVIGSGTGQALTPNVTIQLILGDKLNLYEEKIMKDEAGKRIKLHLMMDALNFMASKGWELDQAYAQAAVVGTSREIVQYFVLRKNFDEFDEDVKRELVK